MHTKFLFLVCLICSTSFTVVPVSKNVLFCPSFLLDRAPGIYACATQISYYLPNFLVTDCSLIQLSFSSLLLPWNCRSVFASMLSTGIKLSQRSFLLELLWLHASRVTCDSLMEWEGILKGRRGYEVKNSKLEKLFKPHSTTAFQASFTIWVSLIFHKKLKDG